MKQYYTNIPNDLETEVIRFLGYNNMQMQIYDDRFSIWMYSVAAYYHPSLTASMSGFAAHSRRRRRHFDNNEWWNDSEVWILS